MPPENNLVWGILTTVTCCLPLRIVSIVKANQVNTLWALGQYDAAQRSAEEAKKWAIWSAVAAGGSWVVIVIIVYAILIATAVHTVNQYR